MATMKDVAKHARVSTATVSRVLNDSCYVQPVTRERVENAMRELNYQRNAAALALATRSGAMLGLLTGNLADPFFARLAQGVEAIARQHSYRLMVCSGAHQLEQEKSGLDFLINQGCEAIVVHATRLADEVLLRYSAHTPAMVLINRYIPALAHRCVWLDNQHAACCATRYLLACGHRCIACVTADLPIADRDLRLQGYQQALRQYGIDAQKSWGISVPFNERGGELAAHQLLTRKTAFSAAVTFNDLIAAGMMHTLLQQNWVLPDQLSLVGFDDVLLARYLRPALTTMHYPVERMARSAATLAIALASQQPLLPRSLKFTAELVERNSVKPFYGG